MTSLKNIKCHIFKDYAQQNLNFANMKKVKVNFLDVKDFGIMVIINIPNLKSELN